MRHDPADTTDQDPIVCTTSVRVAVADEPPVPLTAELRYSAADPYAVCLSLGAPSARSVDWVFARSLLAQGLTRPTGTGDVVVFPERRRDPATVRVLLRTHTGAALLEIACSAVTAFLRRADAVVPPGTEHHHLDVDRVVEQLMAGRE
ncbi:SsgA family sporulation/cell division regulator [Streptomyces cinerochromogenes]|uniref:SsgA family sporulation/cell division regulator n=1 Tax=Streptomyces cinerochromogenes TaxID=66422 RepID=UPI0033A199CB